MNNTLSKIFIFAVGAALGSAVTWKFVETKYKKIADEEIASVKEKFGRGHRAEINPVDDAAEIKPDKTDISKKEPEYKPSEADLIKLKEKIETNGYRDYSIKKDNKKVEEEDDMEPYVIPPEDFDTEDYQVESLTYWNDGVLTDEFDNVVFDLPGTVGEDSLNHFGEYEDDSVFVRNDRTRTDYEILLDTRNFKDVHPDKWED